MIKQLIQAAAITSVLYLIMGMSRSDAAQQALHPPQQPALAIPAVLSHFSEH